MIWRYDPIFLSDRYTVEYHIKAFEEIVASLAGYTDKVVISFIDFYKKRCEIQELLQFSR